MTMHRQDAAATTLSAPLTALSWVDRYLSVPVVFSLLAAATFFIAWNRGITLIYALFAILVGAAIVSVLAPLWMLRAATLRLELPPSAAVGDCITIGIATITQAMPRRRYMLRFAAPYPFAPDQSLFLIASGGSAVRHQAVRCAQRGIYTLRDAEVSCAYPLGLLSVARRWPIAAQAITIYPRVYPVQRFSLPIASSRESAELEQTAPTLGQELFREVRDYRSGDNPRHIHWRNSARHGRLIVKQFDAIASSEIWIVLDLNPASHAGAGEDHTLERAIEIAATLATHLLRAGMRCGIAGGLREDGSFAVLLAPNTGGAQAQLILDALAGVQAVYPADYPATLAALADRHRPGQQWILFDHGNEKLPTPAFLRRDRAPLWFRFDTASFANPVSAETRAEPPARLSDGFLIERDTDIALLFQ